jgi:hypothetical protein
MIAEGMKYAASGHLRRIGCYLVVIIFRYFCINMVFKKLLTLLTLDEN